MTRHARMTLDDDALDYLHGLKRRLTRERGHRVTLDDLLNEGVQLLRRQYAGQVEACPRCARHIPNDDEPGAHRGAVSRTDGRRENCTRCAADEAQQGTPSGDSQTACPSNALVG